MDIEVKQNSNINIKVKDNIILFILVCSLIIALWKYILFQ